MTAVERAQHNFTFPNGGIHHKPRAKLRLHPWVLIPVFWSLVEGLLDKLIQDFQTAPMHYNKIRMRHFYVWSPLQIPHLPAEPSNKFATVSGVCSNRGNLTPECEAIMSSSSGTA